MSDSHAMAMETMGNHDRCKALFLSRSFTADRLLEGAYLTPHRRSSDAPQSGARRTGCLEPRTSPHCGRLARQGLYCAGHMRLIGKAEIRRDFGQRIVRAHKRQESCTRVHLRTKLRRGHVEGADEAAPRVFPRYASRLRPVRYAQPWICPEIDRQLVRPVFYERRGTRLSDELLFQQTRCIPHVAGRRTFDRVDGKIAIDAAKCRVVAPGKSDQNYSATEHFVGMTIEGRVDKHIAGLECQATGIGILFKRACEDESGVSVQMEVSRHALDGRQMIQAEPNISTRYIRLHAANPMQSFQPAETIEKLPGICKKRPRSHKRFTSFRCCDGRDWHACLPR